MVWARSKMIIQEYPYNQRRDLIIGWAGKDPEKAYLEIYYILKDVFNVPDSHIQEIMFQWDTIGNKEKFKVIWRVVKEFDIYSYLRVDISISGESVNGYGKINVYIKPRFLTEYPQDSLFQQTILYEIWRRFWHVVFYDKSRARYLNESRALLREFQDRLKQLFESLASQGGEQVASKDISKV